MNKKNSKSFEANKEDFSDLRPYKLAKLTTSALDDSEAGFSSTVAEDEKKIRIQYETERFERLFAAMEADPSILSYSVFVGIDDGDDDDDDDDDDNHDGSNKVHSKEQVDSLRFIFHTKSREELLTKVYNYVTCGQENNNIKMFRTSSGNKVVLKLLPQIKNAMSLPSFSKNFDALFSLTFALHQYKFWMYDNEYWSDGGKYLLYGVFLFFFKLNLILYRAIYILKTSVYEVCIILHYIGIFCYY
jgi:hypothetical protein